MTLARSAPRRSRREGSCLVLRGVGALDELRALEKIVTEENACALPGCSIKFEPFMLCLRRAVSRGYVKDHHAAFV